MATTNERLDAKTLYLQLKGENKLRRDLNNVYAQEKDHFENLDEKFKDLENLDQFILKIEEEFEKVLPYMQNAIARIYQELKELSNNEDLTAYEKAQQSINIIDTLKEKLTEEKAEIEKILNAHKIIEDLVEKLETKEDEKKLKKLSKALGASRETVEELQLAVSKHFKLSKDGTKVL
jgi:hypothetical protein